VDYPTSVKNEIVFLWGIVILVD